MFRISSFEFRKLQRFTGLAQTIEIELVIRHLVARLPGHLSSPIRDVAEIQLNHSPAFFTDDMMMMAVRVAEPVSDAGPNRDLKDDSKGFEKVEAPIDGRKANLSPLLMKRTVEFLGTQGFGCRRKLLIDQNPGLA